MAQNNFMQQIGLPHSGKKIEDMKIKSIMFFANGNTAVFDEKDEQVSKLQESWFLRFIDFIEKNGGDVKKCEIVLPDGRKAELIKLTKGYNWKILK